ncbi:MAG: hypothetical protein WC498_01740 [Candidatus Saccharimonadales bacterium]
MKNSPLAKIIKSLIAVPLVAALGGILYGILGWGWIDTGMPVVVSSLIIAATAVLFIWTLKKIWRPKKSE